MGFNPRKECLKVKDLLKKQDHTKNISLNVFGVAVMQVIGTPKRVKAGRWIEAFESFGYIEKKDDIINFLI